MRKFLGVLFVAAAVLFGAWTLAPGLLGHGAQTAENDFQATQQLLDTLADGGDSLTFRAGGLSEKDCGGQSGWKYSVNGTTPGKGCSAYTLGDGDTVLLYYAMS